MISLPPPGKFDLGGLVGNVLAGLTVVAAVGVTLATFGAAGPIVLGAMAMGSMAVIGHGVSDVMSGQVSNQEDYMRVGFWSAVAGAVSGMVGSGVSKVLTSKLKMLTPMAVNGLSGMVETVAENAVLGVKTNLGNLGLAFGLSAVLPGIGDNLARGAKQLVGQMDNLVRGIKGMTGQLDNVLRGASRQADEVLEAVLKQTDEVLEDIAKQTDDMLEAAGKQAGDVPLQTPDEGPPSVQSEGGLDTRNINGQRTSRYRELTDNEISQLLDDIEALEADPSIFREALIKSKISCGVECMV